MATRWIGAVTPGGRWIGSVDGSSAVPATQYTLSGPSSGTVNVASTNFTVTPDGTTSGTVTPASSGAGTFSPSSLTWTGDSSAKTFTYTPTSTSGSPHSISITSSPVLTYVGSPIAYTVNAATATAYTLTASPNPVGVGSATTATVTPTGGVYTGTITVTPTGSASSGLSANVFTFSASSTPQTFNFTPTVIGTLTLTGTNSGGLSNPSAVNVTVTGVTKRSDNFNRANSTTTPNSPSDGLSDWQVFRGGTGLPVYGISTNRVYCPTTAGTKGGIVLESSASDVDVSIKVTSVTNAFAGIIFRATDAVNYLYLYFFPGTPGTFFIYQFSPSGNTQLVTTTTNLANGDTLAVHASGSAITVTINGTHVAALDCTSTFNQTATLHGVMLTNPGDFLDDFSVVDNNAGAMTGYYVSSDTTAINLNAVGGLGPFQWYRSTVFGFTPGGGNILSGKTTQVLTDSASLSAGVVYEYALVATGSAETVRVWGALGLAPITFGAIGDSITAGAGPAGLGVTGLPPPERAALMLSKSKGVHRTVKAINQGLIATQSGDWLSGSGNLINAKSLFQQIGVTHVMITLGTNDSASVSAATYLSNMTSLVNDLVSAGYIVLLNYPTFDAASATNQNNLVSYLPQLDSLVNGTTILAGDKEAWAHFAEFPSDLRTDGVHQTEAGAESWATMLAGRLSQIFDPATGGTGGFSRGRTVNASS